MSTDIFPREKSGVSKRNWNPVHNDHWFSLLSCNSRTSRDDVCPKLSLSGILLLDSLFYQYVNTDQTVAAKTAEETRNETATVGHWVGHRVGHGLHHILSTPIRYYLCRTEDITILYLQRC